RARRAFPHLLYPLSREFSNRPLEPGRATEVDVTFVASSRHFEPRERLRTEKACVIRHPPCRAAAQSYCTGIRPASGPFSAQTIVQGFVGACDGGPRQRFGLRAAGEAHRPLE